MLYGICVRKLEVIDDFPSFIVRPLPCSHETNSSAPHRKRQPTSPRDIHMHHTYTPHHTPTQRHTDPLWSNENFYSLFYSQEPASLSPLERRALHNNHTHYTSYRCYCLLSHHPFIALHFDFLYRSLRKLSCALAVMCAPKCCVKIQLRSLEYNTRHRNTMHVWSIKYFFAHLRYHASLQYNPHLWNFMHVFGILVFGI